MTDENCQKKVSLKVDRDLEARDLQFSTDSKFIAIAGNDYTCAIRSVDNKYQEITIIKSHNDEILNLAITKSTSVLVTISYCEGCFFWMRSAESNNNSYILAGRIEAKGFFEVSISDPIGNGDK